MKNKSPAIVLVSGGMDSLVVTGIAHEQHEQIALLHIKYGQKTAQKEEECFHKIADHYHVPKNLRKIIDISFLKEIGGSSLTDEKIEVSLFNQNQTGIPSSYVPFRNTHIISIAVSWAEILGAKRIFIGANEEDSPGYPDCRPAYYAAFNVLIRLGTKEGDIKIETPVIDLTKKEIVRRGINLNVPFEFTWSCYASGNFACGVCDSCVLRLKGFKENGINDPIKYK
jgi:7-cyano-7-deazaguanine synthase